MPCILTGRPLLGRAATECSPGHIPQHLHRVQVYARCPLTEADHDAPSTMLHSWDEVLVAPLLSHLFIEHLGLLPGDRVLCEVALLLFQKDYLEFSEMTHPISFLKKI